MMFFSEGQVLVVIVVPRVVLSLLELWFDRRLGKKRGKEIVPDNIPTKYGVPP